MSSGRCNHFSFTPGRGRIVPSLRQNCEVRPSSLIMALRPVAKMRWQSRWGPAGH